MNPFEFGWHVGVKLAAAPSPTGMLGSLQQAGQSAMQGVKNMGTAANNWSAKNLGVAVPNKAELGASYTNAANNAIQSKPGQAALGAAAPVYNKYAPQAVKGFVGRQMPSYYEDAQEKQIFQNAGVKNTAPQPFQRNQQTAGAVVNADTMVKNDQLAYDRVDSFTPATNFGTPMQQLGFGLSRGEMPSQTFKPNDTATAHTGVLNDALKHYRVLPGQFDQQPAAAMTQLPRQ